MNVYKTITPSVLLFSLFLSACNTEETPAAAASTEAAVEKSPGADQPLAMLYNFDDALDSTVKSASANLTLVGDGSDKSVKIDFLSKENGYSGITFKPESPWDWSKFDSFSLSMDLANDGEQSTQIYLNLKDGKGNVATRSVVVPRGDFKTYYAKLAGHDIEAAGDDDATELNFSSGLRSNPPTWNSADTHFIWMWGVKSLDVSQITEISLSVQGAVSNKTISIDNVRLTSNPKMDEEFLVGIVDEFGQNAKYDYADKIDSLEELHQVRDSELAELDGKSMADRSRFSGWKDGPKLEATGYFRTEKVDGKWALVDPEGYLYFATGLDIIRLSNSTTMTGYDYDQKKINQRDENDLTPEDSIGMLKVSDAAKKTRFVASKTRADMFSWLPEMDGELANHYSYRRAAHSGPLEHGETFSFYQANLERKYGEEYPNSFLDKWEDVTKKRMLNWGFTSLGNWTDPRFYSNEQIPFFANGWIIGDFKKVSSGNDFWGPLPDVFDPKFAERANVTAKQVADEVKNTPWCVGVFIDNEMSFGRPESDQLRYGIVINTLGRDASNVPTKAQFSQLMKAKYESIGAFNQAWDLQLTDWAEFDKGFAPGEITEAQRVDYAAMLEHYATQYYRVVHDAVQEHLPNHLYLGSRLPDWGMPIEVVRAAAKYADVVSYNVYKEGLNKKKWAFLAEIDKPSIIGEFHMGAMDRGLYHPGLIHAEDQDDRAQMYLRYMDTVVENPYFVGAHWFQYMDSPLTGRAHDGENYNVGFVDVTDTPYPEMVEAAKELGRDLYDERYGDE
ncbi:beta-galactosidase [Gilvimarinus agarilyticus]|uniref:beta-galactosidase n=1 Tax=Gilvimarinus agarilyticus TaxID=679259 RepID=UPI0005A13B88|nr:beta-galactosidase [Gilvimarinus agarilyticus]